MLRLGQRGVSTMSDTAAGRDNIGYAELTAFFAPIAVSTMLMMSSHSIVSAALARTTEAGVALAAYSVAQSISNMFQSPCFTLRRAAVALLDDRRSYNVVLRVSVVTLLIVLAAMSAIAFVPAVYRWIFVDLVGINTELLPETVRTFRFFLIMPLFSILRSVYQGIITIRRKTYFLTINMVFRLAVMFTVTAVVTSTNWLSGGAVGAFVLASGIITEGVLAVWAGYRLKRQLPEEVSDSEPISVASAWKFFLPLIAAEFVMTFGRPSINAGLARTVDPETALASFQVARSFAWIFIGMAMRIHQLVLVFVQGHVSYIKVKRFILALGLGNTALLLLLALTPMGEWALVRVIGVSDNLVKPALLTVLLLAFVPLVLSLSEMYVGLLLGARRTSVITLSKFGNLFGVVVLVLVTGRMFPQLGGLLAGLSTLGGYLVEMVVVWHFSRDLIPVSQASVLPGTLQQKAAD